jgi:hypothetical protein
MPPIPDTGWRPPTEFPRLDAASRIAIDCETYDPTLLSKGPGVRTGGYIVGLAIGTDDARWYFPMRHSVQSEMNLDPDAVMHWARDQLRDARQPKVGAHLLYDLDFLAEAGVTVAGPLLDVQIAEPLLDENAPSFSLNALARKHLGESKVEEALYSWAALAYGGPVDRSQASNIHRSPPSLVGPYAEGDVDLPLRILDKQQTQLAAENLTELFDIESRLIPLLLAMRRRGVRVDLDAAQRAYDSFSRRIEHVERGLGGINVFAAEEIAAYCRKHRIEFPLTEKGNPSFTADFLKRHDNALIRSITDVRKWYKTRDTFIKGYILDSHVNGRIHAQFNQLRSDDKGVSAAATRTCRTSPRVTKRSAHSCARCSCPMRARAGHVSIGHRSSSAFSHTTGAGAAHLVRARCTAAIPRPTFTAWSLISCGRVSRRCASPPRTSTSGSCTAWVSRTWLRRWAARLTKCVRCSKRTTPNCPS